MCPFAALLPISASGKTTVCDKIIQRLHDQCVVMLNQDSFYRSLGPDELADIENYNFDHPDAFDTPVLLDCLEGLKAGKSVDIPTYDFSQHKRGTDTKKVTDQKGPTLVQHSLAVTTGSRTHLLWLYIHHDNSQLQDAHWVVTGPCS